MVKVMEHGRFGIYVYAEGGQRHHQPHCHVRWPDGDVAVDLVSLGTLSGGSLPAMAHELVRDHLAEISRVGHA